jgi:hypothetical protein
MAASTTAVHADDMAGVIHRAIKVKPYKIRDQYGEGDPQRYLGRSIHVAPKRKYGEVGRAHEQTFRIWSLEARWHPIRR